MQINFYQVQIDFEKTLCRLLEKIYDSGNFALVLFDSEDEMNVIDKTLWTFASRSFVAHGRYNDIKPDLQPILLSTQHNNLNNAQTIVAVNICDLDYASYEKVIFIFNNYEMDRSREFLDFYNSLKINNAANLNYYVQQNDKSWVRIH